ncbi:MAG: lactate utilization protein C [Acidiferrobacterales bacterium]
MSGTREQILSAIRQSLNRTGPLEDSMRQMLDERLAGHRVHVQPRLKQDLQARFLAKLEAVSGTATSVAAAQDVPRAVVAYLRTLALPQQVVMANDAMLAELDWPDTMTIERRAAQREDHVSITDAFAGIAETGTLVLVSSPQSPTTLNFLPDVHIVVLRHNQIVAHIEDVWAKLRADLPGMPRTVNFITGPSRTADVEQTIQLGAHGPRNLHVILVER